MMSACVARHEYSFHTYVPDNANDGYSGFDSSRESGTR